MKFPSVLPLTKAVKGEEKTPEIRDNPDSFKLMMNYFDKRFERIQKKLQQPSNKELENGGRFQIQT